jgi:cytochrome b involved in lipid metabolism
MKKFVQSVLHQNILQHQRCLTSLKVPIQNSYGPNNGGHQHNYSGSRSSSNNKERRQTHSFYFMNSLLFPLLWMYSNSRTHCLESSTLDSIEDEKPIYTRSEIKDHVTKEKGIWVTHGNGVYDITKFVVNHPGGQEKISLAAGNAVESYWKIYRQHYNKESVDNALKSMLIGYLHPDDFALEAAEDEFSSDDPYSSDPPVSPVQTFHQKYPVNSEAPSTLLNDSWLTPKDMWFKRNHHPVPHPDTEDYRLSYLFYSWNTL